MRPFQISLSRIGRSDGGLGRRGREGGRKEDIKSDHNSVCFLLLSLSSATATVRSLFLVAVKQLGTCLSGLSRDARP